MKKIKKEHGGMGCNEEVMSLIQIFSVFISLEIQFSFFEYLMVLL